MAGRVKLELRDMVYEALRFGLYPRRFLTYFVIDLSALILGFIYAFFNANEIASYFALFETGSGLSGGFFVIIAPLLIIFILWYITKNMFNMAVMKQSIKEESFRKIMIKSKSLFAPFLLATIIIGFINGLFSMAEPLALAYVLTIISTLILFFVTASIAIGKKNIPEAFRESVRIFIKRWRYVIAAWLTIAVVNSLIVFLFMIPGIIFFSDMILYFLINGTLQDSMLFLIMEKFPYLILSGIIFLIGTSISTAVNMKLLVAFYKKLKK